MFLNKLSCFINQKGIGLKIIIPLSFLVSMLLSFQIVQPFQESLEQPQMQSLIELVSTPQIDKEAIKSKLNIQELNNQNYILSVMAEVLFTLHNKGIISQFSPTQLKELLFKAFYVQSLFLACFMAFISILSFLFLYTILKNIGHLFYAELPKNAWGHILSLVWGLILIVYLIGAQFHLSFGLIYFYIIAILASLLLGSKLKHLS